MCDNESNNDTMLSYIQTQMVANNIDFIATKARMRCMPHTIHLAVMKVSNFYFYFTLYI